MTLVLASSSSALTSTADAAPTASTSIVTGLLPNAASSSSPATVTVMVEPDLSKVRNGEEVDFVTAATQTVTSSMFSVALRHSRTLDGLVSRAGTLNVVVSARTATAVTTKAGVLGYTGGTLVAATAREGATSLSLGPMPAYTRYSTAGRSPDVITNPHCEQHTVSNVQHDRITRVGELHVAAGDTATYQYHQEADSTITVGAQIGAAPITADGSASVSNSNGSTAGNTHSGAYSQFVDADYTFAHLNSKSAGLCGYNYLAESTSWDGDVFAGSNKAETNPYGSCQKDPHGFARVDGHGGTFQSDRGRAENYSAAVNVYDFNFSAQTGYSNDNHIN